MTKRDYRNEVRRLAALIWGSSGLARVGEADVYQIMAFITRESPWMKDDRLHEQILEYGEYERKLNQYDHDQIREEMASGEDWKTMRALTARRTLALDVFDEVQGASREGMGPKKRWEPE